MSWGTETARKFSNDELCAILEKLSSSGEFGTILRSKGFVASDSGSWLYFDLVPGEYEVREGSPAVTGRLCVIGAQLDEAALIKLFSV